MYRSSTFLRMYRYSTPNGPLQKIPRNHPKISKTSLCVPYHTVVLKGLMRSGGGAVFCTGSFWETSFSHLGRLVRSPQPVITKYRQVPTYNAGLRTCITFANPNPSFIVMRFRIRFFTIIWIWILLLIKVTATGPQTLHVSIVGPQSLMDPF
jgi:hypothetical protein